MIVRRWIFAAALLAALAAPQIAMQASPAAAAEKSLGVVYADGRQTEDVALAKLDRRSDELFISAYDLARIFKATKFWNPGNRKLVLRIGSHRYMFTIDSRAVVVDETPVLLRMNVLYDEGAIMIPLEFITRVLAPRSIEKIELDSSRLLLSIGSPEYNVTDVELVDDRDATRAVLTLTDELLYHIDSETPGILRLKIYGGRLDPLKFALPDGKGLIGRVRAEQVEQDAYLFFDVKKTVQRCRVEFERAEAPAAGEKKTPIKLVLSLDRGNLPEIPEADFAGKKLIEMLDEGAKHKIIEPVRKIAIDPGHGGSDMGRMGPSLVKEKDINLQIALMLRDRLMEELGVDVVMTRADDTLIPLDERVEAANIAGAQLFISIHCNGWFAPDAEGFEVYFLAPARTEEEVRLARDENSSIAYEEPTSGDAGSGDIDFILWDMVQNEYLNESSDLAEMIQREMGKSLGIKNRGVKQTGLRVLKGLKMPGVLIETAFLSNPKEEKLLLNAEFRERLVEAAIEAIRKFQSRYAGKG
ncbi:MAG: N-acetylmuramoyl-L-alanine amidase [Candidatus Krumholzibacteria bacterium]|nr:N-acetylmuramoyl-L-alanine amidase [Candidatus Krumholzibacteria bacterium]